MIRWEAQIDYMYLKIQRAGHPVVKFNMKHMETADFQDPISSDEWFDTDLISAYKGCLMFAHRCLDLM